MITGIVDQRRAGVGNQRNALAFLQFRQQLLGLLLFVVIVQREQTRVDREVLQQQSGMARIFRRDQINAFQYL
ncbi:hypothetical protein AK51_16400 [Serratia nematodiphila DZ0503SBS1]|nr:hypothetical protein AK51_16400 [Serratia nematodiphila DZ0503SBS1]